MKISEVIVAEVEQITEEDCINIMLDLVIRRTFDGYTTEIETIYGQLQKILQVPIEPAPDKKIGEKYIGLQIKPVSGVSHIPQIYREQGFQEESHRRFAERFGGKVFYVFSIKIGREKRIQNVEVIEEIKGEIARLRN